MKLRDRVAVVTGAGQGIGRGIARRLAEDGATVVIADINGDWASETEKLIRDKGGRAVVQVTDVRQPEQVAAAMARAEDEFGRLDILASNAGVTDRFPFLDFPLDEWNRILTLNLTGVFLCGQAAARLMAKRGGGCIINTASNSGIFGGLGRAAYGASKAGIINLTQSMAMELAPHAIRVNAVAPGPIATHRTTTEEPDPVFTQRMSLKRFGLPAEIGAAVAFLASDDASFINGHVIPVDGGFTVTGVYAG